MIPPGRQDVRQFHRTVTKTVGCRYWLYLPAGYSQGAGRWPLVLFLHGAGERGDDLTLVKRHGPPKLADEGRPFPFILVSPQCPAEQWWSTDVLAALLDEVIQRYAVDEDRVYVTGLSMGGFGTWELAMHQPGRFAAIAPICGWGNSLGASRLRRVPVWAFHGARDDVVPCARSEEMVRAIQAAGGQARLTLYPDAGHDAWTAAYAGPDLYDWLLHHRRQPA